MSGNTDTSSTRLFTAKLQYNSILLPTVTQVLLKRLPIKFAANGTNGTFAACLQVFVEQSIDTCISDE